MDPLPIFLYRNLNISEEVEYIWTELATVGQIVATQLKFMSPTID